MTPDRTMEGAGSNQEESDCGGRQVTAMEVVLFVLGTLVVQGGLVLLVMWLIASGDREAQREDEERRRLAALEAEEERLRKVA